MEGFEDISDELVYAALKDVYARLAEGCAHAPWWQGASKARLGAILDHSLHKYTCVLREHDCGF